MTAEQKSWWSHVHKVWQTKKDPSRMTPREYEQVYRYHFTHIDYASEEQLYYHIHRYMNQRILHPRWFVLLLSQYPTDRNYDMWKRMCPPHDKGLKRVLMRLINNVPDISCDALRLIIRRTESSFWTCRSERKVHKSAIQRLKERELDSFDPGI